MIKKLLYMLLMISASMLFGKDAITLPASFRADFRQTITNDQKKEILYRGRIDFSSPDRFKWYYTEPTRKEICSNSKMLLIVDHDLEQVSSYMIDKSLDLSEILKKAKPHRKTVYIAKYRGKYYTLQVNSRGELSRIAYKDDLDNNVLIVFSKMRYSSKRIPEVKMKCNYPKNYDQIGG